MAVVARLPTQTIQELLSIAYVQAIAARAGIAFYLTGMHDYGIDGYFRHIVYYDNGIRPGLRPSSYILDCQLKASFNYTESSSEIRFNLDASSHRKLAEQNNERMTPCVLVLLCLPRDETLWLEIRSHAELILRKHCYWCLIDGALTHNSSSQIVQIPKSQQFSPEALNDLMVLALDWGRR